MCAAHKEGVIHENSVGPKWSCRLAFAEMTDKLKNGRDLPSRVLITCRQPAPSPIPTQDLPSRNNQFRNRLVRKSRRVTEPHRRHRPRIQICRPCRPSRSDALHADPSLDAGGFLPLSQPPFAAPRVPITSRSGTENSFRGPVFEGKTEDRCGTANSSTEPRGDGIKRVLAGPQNFRHAVFALIYYVLNLIHPTAPLPTDSLQLAFGRVHQPFPSFFARNRRKEQSQAHANSKAGYKRSNRAASIVH